MRLAALGKLKPPLTARPTPPPALRPPQLTVVVTADRAAVPSASLKGPKSQWASIADGRAVTVEDRVLEHFAAHGRWAGVHCECRAWRTAFSYLLLDELFGPADADAGAVAPFRHPYQDRPLDLLLVDAFYAKRAQAIEAKLAVRTGVRALRAVGCMRARSAWLMGGARIAWAYGRGPAADRAGRGRGRPGGGLAQAQQRAAAVRLLWGERTLQRPADAPGHRRRVPGRGPRLHHAPHGAALRRTRCAAGGEL